MAMPQMSMMKESHIDGRNFLSATLLGGCADCERLKTSTSLVASTHLKQGIREEENGQRDQVLLVGDVQVIRHVV